MAYQTSDCAVYVSCWKQKQCNTIEMIAYSWFQLDYLYLNNERKFIDLNFS